jgi:hypothetical protein
MSTQVTRVSLAIDGIGLDLVLKVEPESATATALRAALPLAGEVIHAMWSGPVCLFGFDLGPLPLENPISFLAPGDVVYHPTHHEIGFAYAPTQFREPIGSVYVTSLGRLEGDLDALARLGRRLQRIGARPIRMG